MNFIKKIYNDFVSVRLCDYKGFESELQINKLLFFVCLGLAAACIIISYQNSAATLVLKKLTRIGAFGEENAKTLTEIGLGASRAVKRVLRGKSGAFKVLVITKGEKELSYEEYTALLRSKKQFRGLSKEEKKEKLAKINEALSPAINFDEAEFYIPCDMQDASERFVADKSTTLAKGFIYCGIIFAFYVAIALLMPTLLSWISKIISK